MPNEQRVYRKRRDNPPPVTNFRPTDLELCKLLAHGTFARDPWTYKYLPTDYFPGLLGRGNWVTKRVSRLRGAPYYTELVAATPHSVDHTFLYQLGTGGYEALGLQRKVIRATGRHVAHDLLACMIAASFDLASRRFDVPIRIRNFDPDIIDPDWHVFAFGPYTVFIEADMGTESNNPRYKDLDDKNNIWSKFYRYIDLLETKKFKNPCFLFITCVEKEHNHHTRAENWVELIKSIIVERDLPPEYAEHFCFKYVKYDRFFNNYPDLTPWAVTEPYLRAGYAPFCFVETTNGRQAQTAERGSSPTPSPR